jgi:diacylglycerol kinase (ATP)
MRPLVIANPQSGGGRARRYLPTVRTLLERRLGPIDVLTTVRPAHAVELARDAALEGRALIVAAGGDGTLHEVASGILDAGASTALGYVGLGTGGDFGRTLGITHRLDSYADAVASGHEMRIDVGKVRYRARDGRPTSGWFINVLSVGMGGLVDRYVSETTKALGNKTAYFLASLRALAACERGRLRCTVGFAGGHRECVIETFMIAVCNGGYFGSGMHVAPMAKPDDGCFEVVSINAPGKLAFAGLSHRIYGGRHLSGPGVVHFACDRIAIDLDNDRGRDVFLLDVDGEPLGGLPLEIELAPKALTLRV